MTDTDKRTRVSPDAMGVSIARMNIGMEIADHASEQAVLGTVLQEPDLHPALADVLQAGDFAHLTHGYIWHAFEGILSRNEKIDVVTVQAELKRLAFPLDGDEALMYLGTLMASAPDTDNAMSYATNVHDAALRLRLLEATDEIAQVASDKTLTIDAVRDKSDQLLFAATKKTLWQ